MPILTVGDQFPEFTLTALKGGNLHEANVAAPEDYFETVSLDKYEGKWKVVFFYPKDFTFVCPTEIAAFGKLNEDFEDRDTQVLGGSTDNEFCHFNWRATHPELKDIPFPMFLTSSMISFGPWASKTPPVPPTAPPTSSTQTALSNSCPSPRTPWAGTWTKSSGCSTPYSPKKYAPAIGKRTTPPKTSTGSQNSRKVSTNVHR